MRQRAESFYCGIPMILSTMSYICLLSSSSLLQRYFM